MENTRKIRILIVDDSAMMRTMLSRLLATDPEFEVVGTAADPYIARDKLVQLKPDVMTLDIEMPKMDGISFLEKVMQYFPVRTIIISSLTSQSATVAFRALEVGAIDVMTKPTLDPNKPLDEAAAATIQRIKAVARAKLPKRGPAVAAVGAPAPESPSEARTGAGSAGAGGNANAGASAAPATAGGTRRSYPTRGFKKPEGAPARPITGRSRGDALIAIAASTGGTEAIKAVLSGFPDEVPPILITQHMPPIYSKYFAVALQKICGFEVREAVDGDAVMPNLALVAPGDFHMALVREAGTLRVRLNQDPLLHGVRPAADIMMRSVASLMGDRAVGVVLTGMGRDGAAGLLAMKEAGAYCIAQDEASSVVYGMPKEAHKIGATHEVRHLDLIAESVLAQLRVKTAA